MTKVLIINENTLPKSGQHRLTKPKYLFPFSSQHSPTYLRGNFKVVVSELARIITKYQLKKNELNAIGYQYYEGAHKLSEYIANSKQIDFEDDVARVDFIRFIDTYLFNNDGQMKIIHTYLYNFIGESEPNQTVLRSIAEFINSVFVGNNKEIQDIFKNKETDDVLTKLIIEEINCLVEERDNSSKRKYSNILPGFVKLFREDIKFLVQHKDFFIANFEMFMNYYIFMYICQSVIQFEKLLQGNEEEVQPIYFALDWEAVTKKRPVANHISGYKFIKEHANNLFANEFVLRLLSHNTFNADSEGDLKDSLEVYSYQKLITEIEARGESSVQQCVVDLKNMIQNYIEWAKVEDPPEIPNSIKELLTVLLRLVKKEMPLGVQVRYGQSLDYLGHGMFLKQRGSLGYLLNVQHDFLMLMTAVIVKDERMPFKTLLKEFEKRGIAFDRHSIEEIVTLFNNHNILDKKSDSGDAQYVKPIL